VDGRQPGFQADLFSAVASAFIIEVNSQLQPDPRGETAALLRDKIDNAAFGNDIPSIPQWTGPPRPIVHVQAILFASLAASLFSAFLAMLGKQWLNRYDSADMRGSAIERSQNRQRKLDGVIAWYFHYVMELLPLMLQAALLLLGAALSRYLWGIDITVASVILSATSFGALFYIFIIVAGAASESCPYQTPGSHILRYLWPNAYSAALFVASVFVAVASTFRGSLKSSEVIFIVRSVAQSYSPWWSRGNVMDFLGDLVLRVPHAFTADVRNLGRAVARVFPALHIAASSYLVHVYRRLYGIYSSLQRRLSQQTAGLELRCISWKLQTSRK
jgi:hypothetical protein